MEDLISRDALLEEFKEPGFLMSFIIRHTIEKAPAADAVEVVRCKDCSHYTRSPFGHPTIGWCHIMGSHKPQEWYCADGRVRK